MARLDLTSVIFFQQHVWKLLKGFLADEKSFFEDFVVEDGMVMVIYPDKIDAEAVAKTFNALLPSRKAYCVKPYSGNESSGFIIGK